MMFKKLFKQATSAPRRPARRLVHRKTLHARAASSRNEVDDYESEPEPSMKLSQAFIVVLILHVVAVAGIYGFNTLKEKPSAAKTAAAPPPVENASTEQAAASVPAPDTIAAPATTHQTHTVVPGDTLRRLATKFKTSVESLEKANNLTSTSIIKVGQVLIVGSTPLPAHAESSSVPAAPKADPTPAIVAKAPPVKPPLANKLPAPAPAAPKPLPAAAVAEAAPSSSGKVHVVAKGDNPYSIAKKFQVTQASLMKANNIDDPRKLQIGQKLVIP